MARVDEVCTCSMVLLCVAAVMAVVVTDGGGHQQVRVHLRQLLVEAVQPSVCLLHHLVHISLLLVLHNNIIMSSSTHSNAHSTQHKL